jgi:carbon-monoxide dehydrogenase medium subunit
MSFGSSYLTLPDFQYLRPTSLQEALELLDEHKYEAKIMAGGVGLLAFMKERLVSPTYVVDIKGIKEPANRIPEDGNNSLVLSP